MLNVRNKVIFVIFLIFSFVLIIYFGLGSMSSLSYYTILYTMTGTSIVDKEVSFGMNFLGGFINFSEENANIPFFEDDFLFISIFISYANIIVYLLILIGWIIFSISSNMKKKKRVISIFFFIYLGLYILLIFYMPVRLNHMINQANLKYSELNQSQLIIQHISSSLTLYYEIFILIPPFSVLLFYLLNYITFQHFIGSFTFILRRDIFFKDFYEKVIKNYNECQTWDIKEKLDWWERNAPHDIKLQKQIEFCEIVSSFANSQGGLVIIGITNSTRDVIGVPDIENRLKDLEEKLLKWLRFENKFYQMKDIIIPNNDNQIKSCIAILIYQSKIAISVKQANGTVSYKKRVGPGSISIDPSSLKREKKNISQSNINFLKEIIKEHDLRY